MTNIMLDLETMGTGPDAAIVAIGAVCFDSSGVMNDNRYLPVSLESSMQAGSSVSAGTILWWMNQSKEARAEVTTQEGYLIDEALCKFSIWVKDLPQPIYMWGNGSDFDNVILASAYRRLNRELPWKFYNNRCYRTLKNLFPGTTALKPDIAHHALYDALAQASHAAQLLGRISHD